MNLTRNIFNSKTIYSITGNYFINVGVNPDNKLFYQIYTADYDCHRKTDWSGRMIGLDAVFYNNIYDV